MSNITNINDKNRSLVNQLPVNFDNNFWRFVDSKGNASLDEDDENKCEPDDMISSLSFSPNGEFLAVGDNGGRVIIFKYREGKKNQNSQYKSLLGLTSHTTEFDKLRSVVVTPTVEHLTWMNHNCNSQSFISANSSTLKLWKIKEKCRKKRQRRPLRMSTVCSIDDLKFPEMRKKYEYSPNLIHQYPSLYSSPINGVSVSYDDQYFLVSDSMSVGMFSVERPDSRYELFRLDDNFEETNELVSTMTLFPYNSSLFLYGTNTGLINICDLRTKSYCDKPIYTYRNAFSSKDVYYSSYNEIHCIKVLNDVQMLSRDFMSLSHWDFRMTQRPLEILNVNQPVRYKLWEMIETDSIFHRFQIAVSSDAKYFVTGSYNNQFQVFEKDRTNLTTVSHRCFNRLVYGYLFDDWEQNNISTKQNLYSSNCNLLPINFDQFHDLNIKCPRNKFGSECITERTFDLLDRKIKSFDFSKTKNKYNFEAGNDSNQRILKYLKYRTFNQNDNILNDITDRQLNMINFNDSYSCNNNNSNKNFYPVSFDPLTEGPTLKPSNCGKVSFVSWHPKQNFFVIATQFNLYFYENTENQHIC